MCGGNPMGFLIDIVFQSIVEFFVWLTRAAWRDFGPKRASRDRDGNKIR
jgi:hypothetical protein